MKFESLMLRGLFLACLLVCGLIFGAMVTTSSSPGTVQLAASSRLAMILLTAPRTCSVPPDGVVCARIPG